MGLLRTGAKVAVASSVHGRVQRRQQTRWAAEDQAQAARAAPAPQAAAPAPAPAAGLSMQEKIEQLKQLGELRDAGILSEAEFEVKKAMILQS